MNFVKIYKIYGGDIVFYAQVKKLCDERNTTLTSVAVELGYSKANVTYWKRNASPTGETLTRFAEYFDVSVDFLLGRTDKPEVNK